MKGKIAKIETRPVTFKDGTVKSVTEFMVEGDANVYSIWMELGKKVGEEIDFEPQGPPDAYHKVKIRLAGSKPAGGFSNPRGKSPEEIKLQGHSFAASYAKDIIVACIDKGILTDSKAIDVGILHYNNLFKGILEG
jgi:hypothetical protein